MATTTKVGQYTTDIKDTLYIVEQAIGFTVTGLKPNTRISVFFDKINVTQYCAPATYNSSITSPKVTDYHTIGAKGEAIKTDKTGTAQAIFYVPKATFLVGTRELHVFNYVSDTDTYAALKASHTSEAYGYFRAFNFSNVDAENNAIISTIPAGSTSSVTLTNRGSGTPTAADADNPRFDPLCQTFYIGSDVTKGQDGIYLRAVDLFFSKKSTTQPITIDIRTVENNIPTTTILPHSTVTLPASSVNISTNGATATTFTFDTPIYVRSGFTYAIGISPGGQVPDYAIWTGIVGKKDPVNGTVNANWGQGTLYTSSTGNEWTPIQNQFLKFTLYRKGYETSGSATFVNKDYEFITYSRSSTVPFQVGEFVYQMPSPYAGYVSVNTTSNAITFNVASSGFLSTNLATEFAVNDHILIVGSIPPANTTHRILNWGIFSNVFTAKVTTVDPINNKLTFAYANGATAVAPWANASAIFYKPAKGTVSLIKGNRNITGTGTSFTQQYNTNSSDGENKIPMVAQWSNGSFDGHEVLWPEVISNSTYMSTRNAPLYSNNNAIPFLVPVARVRAIDTNRNLIVLTKSTANGLSSNTAYKNAFSSPSYFAPSRILVGATSGATVLIRSTVDITMNSVQPVVYQRSIQGTDIDYSANLTTKDYTNVDYSKISVAHTNYLSNNEIIVASKSNEINRNGGVKSVKINADLTTTSSVITPSIDSDNFSVLARSNLISPHASNEYTNEGTALSKSISKVVTLADDLDAEDLNVYLTAYKPSNTNILVYAKLLNSADPSNFEDKMWTPLYQVTDLNLFSDIADLNDYKEYQFTLGTNPETIVLDDLITTNNSTTIVSTLNSSNWSSVFDAGQQVVLYTDVGLATYEVHTISTVNSDNSITFANPVAMSNTSSAIIGSMTYPEAAYKNSLNNNIVRYYDNNGSPFDTFKQFAIKIVMLSSNTSCVPKIADMRAIALSV